MTSLAVVPTAAAMWFGIASMIVRSGRSVPGLLVALAAIVVMGIVALIAWDGGGVDNRHPDDDRSGATGAAELTSKPAYVGSGVCADCHGEISELYATHPMSRSIVRPSDAESIEDFAAAHFTQLGREFRVQKGSETLTHYEALKTPGGDPIFDQGVEIAYVVGAGTNGRSYLFERDGLLFQSPISWYSERGGWDLSPGYGSFYERFDRRITEDCMHCHAGRVEPAENGQPDRFGSPVFAEMAIGCERCHGPGGDHVRKYSENDAAEGPTLIVNPDRLTPDQQRSLCYQCHLEGKARVLHAGKTWDDFRPGMLVDEVWTVFVDAAPVNAEGASMFTARVEQMHASKCFTESKGQLTCTSCHDAHSKPSLENRVPFYRERCQACHVDHGCSLPVEERNTKDNSCFECHMPTIASTDIGHTSQYDHRVPRIAMTDAVPEKTDDSHKTWKVFDVGGELLDEPILRRAQGLAWFEQAGRTNDEALRRHAEQLMIEALGRDPEDVAILHRLGQLHCQTGSTTTAEEYLNTVLEQNPNHDGCVALLGLIHYLARDDQQALSYFERLIELNPWTGESYGPYTELLFNSGQANAALASAQRGLSLNPTVQQLRKTLADIYARRGNNLQSSRHRRIWRQIRDHLPEAPRERMNH